MNATELLEDLNRLGIRLAVHGDRLRYSPRSAVTPELANRMKAHSDSLAEQLSHGMLLATQSVAEPAVIQELESLYRDATADYKAKPDEAKHLSDTPEGAAMVLVANTILNLDSALTR